MITLYEHQEIGKELLLSHKKYCLFFEMGTGKTFTALAALMELPPCKVLIVAPKMGLEYVWKKDKNYDLSKHDVTYLNYEKIVRDKNFHTNKFDCIILDEAHRLKGRRTKTSKIFTKLTAKAQYVWGLTGTPTSQKYVDIYNIYKAMSIVEFEMSYDEFVARYYYTRVEMSDSGFPFLILLNPKKDKLEELARKTSKHSMVKRLKECLDLPDKRTDIIYIQNMVSETYKSLNKGVLEIGGKSRTLVMLDKINKKHQAANGFVYDQDKNAHIIVNKNTKLEYLDKMLEDMLEETNKVIVVYNFQQDLVNLKTLKYDWTTNPDEFEKDKQILFIQFSAGESLNLQYCNHMVLYSYNYSFAKYDQICGRIYRDGQVNNVVYTVLISKGTIEEIIWKSIQRRWSENEWLKEALKHNEQSI